MSSYPGISQYKSGFGRVSLFQMLLPAIDSEAAERQRRDPAGGGSLIHDLEFDLVAVKAASGRGAGRQPAVRIEFNSLTGFFQACIRLRRLLPQAASAVAVGRTAAPRRS